MNDTTAVETTAGHVLLVEIDDAAGVLTFLDDTNLLPVRSYRVAELATVDGALAIDLGAGVILDAVTVAGLQQWARC